MASVVALLYRIRPLIAAGLLVGILASCGRSGWRKLSVDEVLDVLPEFSLLTATLSEQGQPDSIRQEAYRAFFEARGLTLADWDSTMAWYAKNRLTLYKDFYRLSADSLSRMQRRLQGIQDSLDLIAERSTKKDNGLLDSINLLNDSVSFYSSGELINRYFALTPSVGYDSTTLVHVEARLAGLPDLQDSLSLTVGCFFADSTTLNQSLRIGSSGRYTVVLQIPDGKSAVRVWGSLQGIVPELPIGKMVMVDRFRLFKYGGQSQSASEELQDLPAEATEQASYEDVVDL
ncbi:MAG: hypothetical protein Q4A64_07135 [Porphyromonadaceae bacterium]|nr:hypothetical protein [Porphyromonadaceae bacterium]